MNIRPKTIRRLLTLGAIACVVIAVLLYANQRRMRRHQIELTNLRHDAFAAYDAADYQKAVGLLFSFREYLRDNLDGRIDPDAELAYAKSSAQAEQPTGHHISEAIHTYENYLQNVKPGDPAAERELLQLYVQQGFHPEAVRLADEILSRDANDAAALELKARALYGEHKFDDALAVSQKLNEVDPLDLGAQLLTISVMSTQHVSSDAILAHVQALQKAHPDDPRFDLLMAAAYQNMQNAPEAIKWLHSAASRTPPNALFVAQLVAQLDFAELYPDAADFLARAADALPDVQVQRLYAQRLWQDRKIDLLADRLKSLDPAKPATDGMLIGYRALALYTLQKMPEAQALVDAESHRPDAPSAAWAIALQATQNQKIAAPLSLTEVANRLLQASTRDQQNPILHVMLADAYFRMNEADLCINQCMIASELTPSWATPYLLMAQAQNSTGRYADAVDNGTRTLGRAPTREAIVTLAKADFNRANESANAADYQKLSKFLESVQAQTHDTETLPIYVTVLARTGRRDDAIAAIHKVLSASPPPPAVTLASLAEVADNEHLDAGPEIRAALQAAYGSTPENAVAQAGALLKAGKAAEGQAVLLAASKGHETDLVWRMTIAGYRDMAGDPAALQDWTALAAQYPDNLQVQEAVLRATCRFRDRPLWAHSIDRVKALTSDSGELWRIERARWLLMGTPTEQEKAEAVNQLTGVTAMAPTLREPHRLLAMAMERVNNTTGAIDQLASVADSGDPAIIRELVRLLLSANRAADAVKYLDKLNLSKNLNSTDRAWLAGSYADLGDNDKALAILRDGASPDDLERDRKLAELYRRLGKTDEAASLYKTLLDKPIAEPGFFLQAASFFAGQQDMATANQFLAKLDKIALAPGELELTRAQFTEMFSTEAEATAHYQAATTAAPNSPRMWGALAAFHLRHGRFTDVSTIARQGLAAVPNDPDLMALNSSAGALGEIKDVGSLQTLMDALSRNPRDAGANEMLAAVTAGREEKLSPAGTAQKLREIADRYPGDLLLQMQAARSLAMAGRTDTAIEVAKRAAETNATSGEPQRLLAGIFVTTGDWTHAERAALLWKQRSPETAMAASQALAGIYLSQPNKDPASAARVLAPYIAAANDSRTPPRNAGLLDAYSRALALSGRSDEAAALIKPLLNDSSRWRIKWLDLATLQKDGGTAIKWMEDVTPLVQPDFAEQFALAAAWSAIGRQFGLPQALDKANAVLKPLLTDDNNQPGLWTIAAQIAQAQSDFPTAENAYRRLLKIDPQAAMVMNNLAYTLWLHGRAEDLPEAQRLTEAAIALQSNQAVFYDTLARLQAKSGKKPEAIQSFRTALQKDPASVEAMIGLADQLSHDPATRQEAKNLLARIESLMPGNPRLAPILRDQFQSARQAVANAE